MRVLEIKNNLVKIAYDVKENLALSGFVIIQDENTPYVGQIVNLLADETVNTAIARLLFTFDEQGVVKNYDGTIPSSKASVTKLPAVELLDILPVKTNLKLGKLAQQKSSLVVDFSLLERDLVICLEKETHRNIMLQNFVLQLEKYNKNTVIFDIDGMYNNDDKVVFSKDFKLPLNFETIDFIYENDLEDVDATSKAIIQDIFLEVQEYTKTVENGFIPFDTFINVVDTQYRETEIPQLILLKNKLLKYKEENVFAQTLDEIKSLKTAITSNKTTVIDISVFNSKLQKEIIAHTYNILNSLAKDFYTFVALTNNNSDKKLLKRFLTEENIYTNILCSHEYKYLPELKQYASNLILFAPQTTQHDFAAYNSFLNKLNPDEFVMYGNLTQNIPFIVELDLINLDEEDEDEDEEEEQEVLETAYAPQPEIQVEDNSAELDAEPDKEALIEQVAKDVDSIFTYPEEEVPAPEEIEQPVEEILEEEIPEQEEEISPVSFNEIRQTKEFIAETEPAAIEQLENETITEVEDETVTPDEAPDEIKEAIEEELTEDDLDFIEDISQAPVEEEISEAPSIEPEIEIVELEEEIPAEQSDVVEEELEIPQEPETSLMPEEEAEEVPADTQFQEEELPQPEFIKQEEPTPVVPVYDADEFLPQKEIEIFEQGDSVSHPKYGHGVVEKMIKYGNKTLCSINFDNVGRRLLDPAISEISKL